MYETLYLTGAAGTGKSTLSRSLAGEPDFAVFEYGAEVLKRAAATQPDLTHAETRADPRRFISSADVEATDEALQAFVAEHRGCRHAVIDSRAVTKEPYGFRAEPFTPDRLVRTGLTRIVVLQCAAEVLVERRAADPDGRPLLSLWEAEKHLELLQSLAVAYAVASGIPVHFLDCTPPPAAIRSAFMGLIGSHSY